MSPHNELRTLILSRLARVLDAGVDEQAADAVMELFYHVDAYWSLLGSPYLVAEAKSSLRPIRGGGS